MNRGWLKHGNPPGDPSTARRCGARSRTRGNQPCRAPAIRGKRRCRMHGGRSTGPRTPEGRARSTRARWIHGSYSAEAERELRRFKAECAVFTTVQQARSTALLVDLRLLLKRGRRARRNARRRARRRTDERVTAIRHSARTQTSVEPVAPTARVAKLPVEPATEATPVKALKGAAQPKNATAVDDLRSASNPTKVAARGPRSSDASAYQQYPEWLYHPDYPDGRLVMNADDAAALGPGWCDTPDPTVLAKAAAVLRQHAREGRRTANDSSQSRSKKAAGQ